MRHCAGLVDNLPRRGENLRHVRTATGLVTLLTAVAGCGGGEDYANDPRPPTPVNLTAAITGQRVTVSPTEIGAGPVVIIVANQTPKAQTVTVETDVLGASEGGIRQSTAPINPGGAASLKIDMRSGRYTLHVADRDVAGARLRVGRPRPTSQNELLQP
jgi:hypothetical protein